MTYVMSDIHGDYRKYKQALAEIQLSDADTLYVLGDVVDRGSQSMPILMDMMCRGNLIPLLGNHEFMALSVLPALQGKQELSSDLDPELLIQINQWHLNGGKYTIAEFMSLNAKEQEDILEYLGEFDFYRELSIQGTDYVLSHAGISNFDPEKKMEDYSVHDLIFRRMDYQKMCFPDKFLISGHTPTRNIHKIDRIYRGNQHIAIDCGCGWGGPLAVLCLETQQEWYVS